MHIMASMQLMGEAGDMQVPDATLAGIYNMEGAAVANFRSILERALSPIIAWTRLHRSGCG